MVFALPTPLDPPQWRAHNWGVHHLFAVFNVSLLPFSFAFATEATSRGHRAARPVRPPCQVPPRAVCAPRRVWREGVTEESKKFLFFFSLFLVMTSNLLAMASKL